jgi:hypothetical protein
MSEEIINDFIFVPGMGWYLSRFSAVRAFRTRMYGPFPSLKRAKAFARRQDLRAQAHRKWKAKRRAK